MSTRITDLPQAETLNGSEVMPLVQNGVTKKATLDFINLAAPAALILQQTQQVYQDTVDVKTATDAVLIETQSVLTDTQNVLGQTVTVRDQTEALKLDFETQYLGPHPSAPTLNNEGGPLEVGALYWDTTLMAMFVWDGATWTAFSSVVASVNGFIGEVVLNYTHVGAAGPGANTNITSLGGLTGDVATTTGVQFDTAAPSAAAVGKLTWNVEDSTLDLGMAGGVVQQIGQEMFYSVQNRTGFPINGGSVVRAVGTLNTSGRILVAPATADGVYPSHTFMGVATETIQDGDPGLVTFFGKVRDINTIGAIYGETWVDGDILYAHPWAAGGLTRVKPQAPNNIVMVALVIKAAVSGTLFVRTTYGSNLRDDELVRLNGLADGDVLQYDADLGRFENRTLSGAGIEPLGAAADSMVAHLAALDPHPQYTTATEASAAAPVQSVAGKTGAVSLTKADVELGNVDNTSDVDKPISTATQNALNLKLNSNDPSVTNAREWTAQTVSQVEAEAGTATTRRAWTAERVFQAIAAWWNASAFKTKLDGIQAGAQVNTVNSVAGKTGAVSLTKADVELGNVTNDAQLKIVSNLSDLNNATEARTNLGLGTAATATVTTSATDTTEGRLLKVGDFGLGVSAGYAGNLDALSATGFYKLTETATGGPSGADALGCLLIHQEWDVNTAFQIFCRYSTGQMYRRQKVVTWQSWREIYDQQSILGTVGQVAGLPTGAIIERGANANGEYVRFADGTQICTFETTTAQLPANSTSFIYHATPAAFSQTYPVVVTASGAMLTSWDNAHITGFYINANQFSSAISPGSTAQGVILQLVAIGRWF